MACRFGYLCQRLHPWWCWFYLARERLICCYDKNRVKFVRRLCVYVCADGVDMQFYDFHHINVITWNFVKRLWGLWQYRTEFTHLIWIKLKETMANGHPECNDFIVCVPSISTQQQQQQKQKYFCWSVHSFVPNRSKFRSKTNEITCSSGWRKSILYLCLINHDEYFRSRIPLHEQSWICRKFCVSDIMRGN